MWGMELDAMPRQFRVHCASLTQIPADCYDVLFSIILRSLFPDPEAFISCSSLLKRIFVCDFADSSFIYLLMLI